MEKTYLILGYGYAGEYLKKYIQNMEPGSKVLTSSRGSSQSITFDLQNRETWGDLPKVDTTFWTFPAKPLGLVKELYQEKKALMGKLVTIASTSSLKNTVEGAEVTESQPKDLNQERVICEEWLREQGGITVCASGLYGPNKSPKSWLESGYLKPSHRYLNLIHIEDLAQFLYQAMKIGEKGAFYVASDEKPHTWNELAHHWRETSTLKLPDNARESHRVSKRIDSSWSRKQLNIELKYPSFLEGNFK